MYDVLLWKHDSSCRCCQEFCGFDDFEMVPWNGRISIFPTCYLLSDYVSIYLGSISKSDIFEGFIVVVSSVVDWPSFMLPNQSPLLLVVFLHLESSIYTLEAWSIGNISSSSKDLALFSFQCLHSGISLIQLQT